MSGGRTRTPDVSGDGDVIAGSPFRRRAIRTPTNMTAPRATTPSARFRRDTSDTTASKLVPTAATASVRAPYHSPEARASGTRARGADRPASPAKGGTTAPHTGNRRDRKNP